MSRLRQLDPVALLTLKATGSCVVSIPEWLYDMDCPGHYMRRIKSVALSIPAVAGPYTSVNCTLSLLRSSLRTSTESSGGYKRQESEEDSRLLIIRARFSRSLPAALPTTAGCLRPTCAMSASCPSRASAPSAPGSWNLPADYRAFDTQPFRM